MVKNQKINAIIERPAGVVEIRRISDLAPYAKNSRTHTPEQIDQIATSMREFGWTVPIVIDEGGQIIAGHARIMAAQKLGVDEAPCVAVSRWSEAQKAAYCIADNQLALNAGWDEGLLKLELISIRNDIDLSKTGFSSDELSAIFGEIVHNIEDEWKKMPDYNQENKTSFKDIIVHFKDQKSVDDFASIICQKITEKTRFIWFPEVEIEKYVDKRYSA